MQELILGAAKLTRKVAPQNPLLRQPAAADNAAMQTEPPEADAPKRKRRWFQFSLRSLLIGVTIFCLVGGWLGRELFIARQRLDTLKWLESQGGCCGLWPGHKGEDEPSIVRRLFGDREVQWLQIPRSVSDDDAQRLMDIFPNATAQRL
jgi:hypothetical protein